MVIFPYENMGGSIPTSASITSYEKPLRLKSVRRFSLCDITRSAGQTRTPA
jgi:hypothetical protein